MAKRDTIFVCQECGYESPKWMGQCICGAWNSLVEERVAPSGPAKGIGAGAASNPGAARRTGPGGAFATASESAGGAGGARGRAVQLRSVDSSAHGGRMATGISELDRVLGGGLVAGSLTLIAGEPGIGKSTLILQAATRLAALRGTVLYVSGEESAEQLKRRADRITESPVHRNDAVLSHNAAAHNQITSGISHTEPNAMRDQIPNGITHTEPNTTRDQIPNGISHTEPNTMRDQIPNGISHTEPNTMRDQIPNGNSHT
ncbi:MAG: DNA repair protein RadA, partial [Clostridiales Family XIII bacterium]|nr:DNA repair protein RadA [Clostridiales Family XIII bacterium]